MHWIYLIIAGVFEIAWAIGLKYSDGFTKMKPTVFTIISMILSFVFLAAAVKKLPVGTAYAIWTGIGTIGTLVFGMIYLEESRDFLKLFFISMIVIGIVGLRLAYSSQI